MSKKTEIYKRIGMMCGALLIITMLLLLTQDWRSEPTAPPDWIRQLVAMEAELLMAEEALSHDDSIEATFRIGMARKRCINVQEMLRQDYTAWLQQR